MWAVIEFMTTKLLKHTLIHPRFRFLTRCFELFIVLWVMGLGFFGPGCCGSVFGVILLRLLDCDINLTGIFGNRPSLNPFIVPKWPLCQMWNVALKAFTLISLSNCISAYFNWFSELKHNTMSYWNFDLQYYGDIDKLTMKRINPVSLTH